ncbi:hypothetical protein ACWDYH_14015 [Nocardia goodfellowii]
MASLLTGFLPNHPPLPSFRIQLHDEIIEAELIGRVVPIREFIRGHLPVLQFVVMLPGNRTDAVIQDEEGSWVFRGEPVALLDAQPWLED